jgi:hypothetical protein
MAAEAWAQADLVYADATQAGGEAQAAGGGWKGAALAELPPPQDAAGAAATAHAEEEEEEEEAASAHCQWSLDADAGFRLLLQLPTRWKGLLRQPQLRAEAR